MSARRIGLLSPHRELPGEVADVVASAPEPVAQWQVLTAAEDSHDIEDLIAAGADEPLLAGVERLRRWRPHVVAWACTSGSFVGGRARALGQARTLERAAGAPATSTSLAFVEALSALGIDEVSVASPYPKPATVAFVAFLREWGIAVRAFTHLDCPGGVASALLGPDEVWHAIDEVADGAPVLLPDTAVWGLELRRELAPRLSAPLLVANQVTLWHAFALAGLSTDVDAFAELRRARPTGVTAGEPAPAGRVGSAVAGHRLAS